MNMNFEADMPVGSAMRTEIHARFTIENVGPHSGTCERGRGKDVANVWMNVDGVGLSTSENNDQHG